MTGGGGVWTRSGMVFGMEGSSIDTWKTGWTACILAGKRRVQDKGPAWAMMLNGPRYFSNSFFEAGCSEEFCFDESLITDFEVRWRNLILICGTLILFLRKCDGISKFHMEFVEFEYTVKLGFWTEMSGPKSCEVLASTCGLRRSLDGCLEFRRSGRNRRVRSRAEKKLKKGESKLREVGC